MFAAWKEEKAVQTLIDEAQAMADRLGSAKPHVVETYAANAWYWAAVYRTEGRDLSQMSAWKPADLKRFTTALQTKIAALRKARSYEQSDGLSVWLHAARALAEPRIKPPVDEIWQALAGAGPNAQSMADEMLEEAGLPPGTHPPFAT